MTLIANLATHHLWGSRASLAQLLAYLLDGEQAGPAPDWDVGHFACVVGAGAADRAARCTRSPTPTRRSATAGVHLQPRERLAAALERRDMPAGGMLVGRARARTRAALRAGAAALGLREGLWDNGTRVTRAERERVR